MIFTGNVGQQILLPLPVCESTSHGVLKDDVPALALSDLLKEKKAPRVIVNMEKVRYIDSAGVASLVEGLKVSRDMKSTFALYGLSKTAQEVFELTRLVKVFEIYITEEDALRGGSANTNVAPVR